MKVKATKLGYYGLSLRKPGSVFNIKSPDHFSNKWMEKYSDKKKVEEEIEEPEEEAEEEIDAEPL